MSKSLGEGLRADGNPFSPASGQERQGEGRRREQRKGRRERRRRGEEEGAGLLGLPTTVPDLSTKMTFPHAEV